MDLLLFASGHLLILAVLAATWWMGGGAGARLLRLPEAELPAGLRLGLGFALSAQLLLALGFLGLLRPLPILLVAVALVLGGLAAGRPHWGLPGSRRGKVAAGLYALPVFLLALYPPLGFDQTLYHLPFARAFARSGGLPFLGELRFPVFPPLVEVVQGAIWQLAGVIATQLAGLFALLACLALLWRWTREKAGPEAGFFAVAMLFGSPCIVYVATCGYLEPVLALFILGAFYAAEKAVTDEGAGQAGWPLLAGLFAGSAAASKYHGLFFVAAAGVCLLRRETWPANLRRLALYGAAVLVAAGPAYLRLYHLSGSPLFPFYPELFGSSPWTEESMLPRGSERWQRVATLLWDLSFRRQEVGWLPPYSPVFLLVLPMAIYALFRWPDLRRTALVALVFLLISPTHGHYFSMAAALWALVFAAGLARLFVTTPARRRWLLAAAALLALGGPAYAVWRVHLLGPPPADAAGRDRLLAAQLPTYDAVLFLNREAGRRRGEASVFAAGPVVARMTSYYDGILLGDVNGVDSVARVGRRAGELGSLAAALDEIGAAWLLLDVRETEWLALAERDKRLAPAYRDAGAAVYRVAPPGTAAP